MEQPLFLEQLMHGPWGWLTAGFWGAVWGSFFNVLMIRLPAGESIVRPASHCRSCGTPLRWYHNLPIISYLVLRGRCGHCGARFSARYLLVEVLVCLLALGMFGVFVRQAHAPLGLQAARFVITSLFCGLLVAIAGIDLATMRIPDVITYPAIPLCMALSQFMATPHWWDGPVGGIGGYLLIRGIADGYYLLTRREGMGYGDAKLLAMIGGLLGWQALLPVLFFSAFQGTVIGISLLLWSRRRSEHPAAEPSLRHTQLPFGPFLGLAAVEVILLHQQLPLLFPYLW